MAAAPVLRLPDFLIVGGMKCGSTTLYRDLESQPRIFFPVHKEPSNLCFDEVLTEAGMARYANLFRSACPDQLCGEASTGYTKLPLRQHVPQRARQVLGSDVRIIYSVREPVARALSHHRHLFLGGMATDNFEETLRRTPDLIAFGRYAMQIEPWIETFGRKQVHIAQLESYSNDRRSGLVELCKFLGIEAQPDLVHSQTVFRAAKDKRKVPSWMAGPWRQVTCSHWYLYRVRPKIPDGVIAQLKRLVLRSPPPPPPPPRPAIIDAIIDAVRDDADKLRQIMGRDQPLWDFDAVRAQYVPGAGHDQPAVAAI